MTAAPSDTASKASKASKASTASTARQANAAGKRAGADTAAKPSQRASLTPAQQHERAVTLVHDIARHHFGQRPRRVVEISGGLTNIVYACTVGQGAYIVRSHADATKINDYLKEQWAMEAARAAGLPVPTVLEVGNVADGRPYMILEHVPGVDGRQAPDRLLVLEMLGIVAARLHGVRTHGVGPVFDWSGNRLSRHTSWAGWLRDGFNVQRRLAVLRQHRMLGARSLQQLQHSANAMALWRKPPVLQHGDLRLKNTLVDPGTGALTCIIDWDNAISLPAPHWELSLALHDLGVDEKEAFLSGYGVKPVAMAAAQPFICALNLLNYAHAVESAAAKRDSARLERLRLRFKGGLDLFQAMV